MGQVVHLLHLLASDFAAFSCFFLIFAMMRGFVILGKQWKTQNMIKTCLQDAGRLDCEDHLKSKKNLTMPRAAHAFLRCLLLSTYLKERIFSQLSNHVLHFQEAGSKPISDIFLAYFKHVARTLRCWILQTKWRTLRRLYGFWMSSVVLVALVRKREPAVLPLGTAGRNCEIMNM